MPKSKSVPVGSNNPPSVLKPSLQVSFKPPITEKRYHYVCPKCRRKYFSRIETNGVCKYCSDNPKLISNLRRKKEKPGKDEINMDLGLFSRDSRHSTPISFVYKPPIFEDEDEDEVEEELANLDDDLSDFDFEPPARDYDISMRLTPGPNQWKDGARDPKNVIMNALYTKTFQGQIEKRAGRPVTTSQAMGQAIKGKGTISASKVSHRSTPFKPGGKTHDEWCHLLGDALGGETSAKNLVAGSYGCNTYMAALEMILIGMTQLNVEATAHCNTKHVAEFIQYKISLVSNPNKSREYSIDAANNDFTVDDMKQVQEDLLGWLKLVKA